MVPARGSTVAALHRATADRTGQKSVLVQLQSAARRQHCSPQSSVTVSVGILELCEVLVCDEVFVDHPRSGSAPPSVHGGQEEEEVRRRLRVRR